MQPSMPMIRTLLVSGPAQADAQATSAKKKKNNFITVEAMQLWQTRRHKAIAQSRCQDGLEMPFVLKPCRSFTWMPEHQRVGIHRIGQFQKLDSGVFRLMAFHSGESVPPSASFHVFPPSHWFAGKSAL
jgi:hypothetical protein